MIYRDRVARLQEALQAGPAGQDALDAARSMIDRIVLMPVPGGAFEIELIGKLASMVSSACRTRMTASMPIRRPVPICSRVR